MKSMKDKIGKMNSFGIALADAIKNKEIDWEKLSKEEMDDIYAVADGLTEGRIMDIMEGRTSISKMLKNTPESLELVIDLKIKRLKAIKDRYLVLITPE